MLTLAPIFTDYAVLQRNKPVRIFGTSDAKTVTVRLGETETAAAVRPDGTWTAVLPPMPAGDPTTLTVTDGTDTLTRRDVVLGEVWLCGGQSNMELALKDSNDPEPSLSVCKDKAVRLYHVGKRGFFDDQFYEEERGSRWQLPCRETCQHWTAIGYHFAVELSEKLGVTVGLVECNYGGTSASAWISEELLSTCTIGRMYLDDYAKGMEGLTDEEACHAYLEYCEYQNAWQKRIDDLYREAPRTPWAKALEICGENRYPGPWAPNNALRPHGLYDTMLSRITPYTLKGVLYYQGESDDHRPDGYAELLSLLIRQWRKDFLDNELPFLLVQLPMFCYEHNQFDDNWARIRAAQEQVFRTTKNTGLAVILDCGQFNEIHPKEKRIPAQRLVMQALERVYKQATDNTTSPLVRGILPEGNGILVRFWHAEKGLELRGDTGFELCDASGQWHRAVPEIRYDGVFLHSDEVESPIGARYAWINYGDVTLFSTAGLPAAPFMRML